MKQFIVLAVVLLAVQSIHGGAIVEDACTCKDTLNSLTKDEIITRVIKCNQSANILEQLIRDLNAQHECLMTENDALSSKNCKLLETLKIEKAARECAERALKDANDQIIILRQQIEELKKQLAAAQLEIKNCNQQLTDCKNENERLRCLINDLNAQIKQLQDQLNQCKLEEQNLKCQLKECEERLIKCQNELIACEADEAALKAEIARLRAEIARLQKENAACESALNSLRCDTNTFLIASQDKQSRLTAAIESARSESTNISSFFASFKSSHDLTCNTTPCEA